ncbi:MAG: TetR/AcrR family transcriptional regulator [Spirochaetaceae bacterium]
MAENKPKEVRRQEILDVALYCFTHKGYSGTSIDDICKKAKITKGGLYWHFDSKKQLLDILVETQCNSQQDVWENLENITITENTIREMGHLFISSSLKNRSKVKFLHMMEIETYKNSEMNDALSTSHNLVFNFLLNFAEKLLNYYNNKTMDNASLANLLNISVMGIVKQKILGAVEIDEVSSWDSISTLIVKGLK